MASRICVKDEGAGLSQEDMSRLFGRFQRLSAKPTGGESSTGLGLSIVKRIVELHGGTRRRGEPRPGPRRDLHDPAAGDGRMNTARAQHIVVVDDEAPAREMVGDYLRLHGFEVTLCDGGASLRQHIDEAGARPDRARSQHAGGGRPLDRALRSSSSIGGADHHADRDREPDRSRGRARARRRRLSRQALRAARAAGAHPVGAAPRRPRPPLRPRAPATRPPIRFGTKWLDVDAQVLRDDDGNEHPLASSEFALLKAFAENPKRVLSRERLLDLAEARDREAFDRAIDVRITRIRKKIEPDPARPSVIRTVRGAGYLFSPDGASPAEAFCRSPD